MLTLLLHEAECHHNACPQYILKKQGTTTVRDSRVWNDLQLLLLYHKRPIQTTTSATKPGP